MSTASADYYNTCGFFPSLLPQPTPDGNGMAGLVVHTWPGGASYEYFSQCLTTPMLTGQTYELGFNLAAVRLQFGMIGTLPINFGPLELAIFGLDTCPPLPYTFYDPVFGNELPSQYCPTELGFTELGHVTYNPSNAWQEVNFSFIPTFDVGAILIGPACPIPQDYNMWGSSEPYFFFDDFSLENVEVTINRTGHPCTNDLVLQASPYEDPPNTYQWYLNGVALVGQTGPTLNASSMGLGVGMYAIRVIRADGSCIFVQNEVVAAYPVPLMSVAPASGCVPLNLQLTNQTAPALSGTLLWDLGDGGTSGANLVSHTYTQPGTYDVRLTVTSAEGCVKDSLFEDVIVVHPRPRASFTTSDTEACAGVPITFTDTSTPADPHTCSWSFGDGSLASTCPATHAYTNAGTYNVLLSVTNTFGCSDDTLMAHLIHIIPTPVPDFSHTVDSGCVPLEVRFENHTPEQETQSAAWDLGNGQTATTANAVGLYDTPGTYTVTLTMTNTLGCSATLVKSNAVTAHGLPVVTFFVEPDSGCAPLEVVFTNTTDPGMIGGCSWAFGDGATSGDCATVHTYTHNGTYNVSLTVNSPAGCEGDTTLYHLVHVDPSPRANFTIGPQPTDFYHSEITFTDHSSADVTDWSWHFPTGAPAASTNRDVVVRYPNDRGDTYTAMLTVANEFGCTDTRILPVVINGIFSIYAPNAFTPDGDDINAVFLPIIRDDVAEDHDLRIFDRWGREVFHSADPAKGWDGTVNGEEPKEDVYIWKIHSRNGVDGILREYTGHVTVLR
jgi:gliding motility-associated-like protein